MPKTLFSLLAGGALLALTSPVCLAEGAKNLQVLPKNMPVKEVKSLMKAQAKALGVECEHCHDMDDFATDTKMKKVARQMMTMVGEVNKKFFAGKDMVACATCHEGHEMPAMGGAELERIKAEHKH